MSQIGKRAQFYHNLATLEGAGVPRVQALKTRHQPPFSRIAAEIAEAISEQGITLSQAMAAHPHIFSRLEQTMVHVAERTGTMESVLRSLAEWYELVGRLRSRIISGLIYPLLLFHFAALAIPAIQCIMGTLSVDGAVKTVGWVLGMPYALCFFFFVLRPKLFPQGLPLSDFAGWLLLQLPLLGTIIYKVNNTRFFRALALALKAGMGTVDAVRLGAETCTNPWLRSRYRSMAREIEQSGCTFTEAFQARLTARDRNSIILAMMQTGELSGTPDQMATRIAARYEEESEEALRRAAAVIPVLIYIGIMVWIGTMIISFYAGYFQQVRELL